MAEAFPQHGPGRKHLRPIVLQPWQQEIIEPNRKPLIHGLIHSDGCRVVAHERQEGRSRDAPRCLFTNLSMDILQLFCESCDSEGVRWTRLSGKTVAIYRLQSVARFDEFVGPKS